MCFEQQHEAALRLGLRELLQVLLEVAVLFFKPVDPAARAAGFQIGWKQHFLLDHQMPRQKVAQPDHALGVTAQRTAEGGLEHGVITTQVFEQADRLR